VPLQASFAVSAFFTYSEFMVVAPEKIFLKTKVCAFGTNPVAWYPHGWRLTAATQEHA
jgi:hypothetical protein